MNQVCGKRETLEYSSCNFYLYTNCMRHHTCDIDAPELPLLYLIGRMVVSCDLLSQ